MNSVIKNSVIGYPLEHSLSPILHNKLYRLLGITSEFVKCESSDIDYLVKEIKEKSFELISVTMPHKQAIIKYLDEVDEIVKKLGAVNTVINKNGKLIGYNTDIFGIEYALRNVEIKNKNVLIIGAGGVARPVAYFISQAGGKLLFNNRTREKAETLAQDFGGKVVEMEDIKNEDIDIIINTTSLGMYPDVDEMLVPLNLLSEGQVVFDVIYNPLKTRLLIEAEKRGAKIISGLDMFIAQGIRQIELWQDIEINIEEHLDKLKELLINKI